MTLLRKKTWINDDFGFVEDVFDNLFPLERFTYTLKGYDDTKYDLVPKKSYIDELIKENEMQLEALEESYKNKKKQLKEEKENLLTQKQE